MATSLSSQLQDLQAQVPDHLAHVGVEKRRPSLLFDAKDAAKISLDTIYSLGISGYKELVAIDSGLGRFEKALFSEGVKNILRTIESASFNKLLSSQIDDFLYCISPYFLLKPTSKVLEWLFRRFRIQSFNCDALVGSILPYHETKLFARVVQMLAISNTSHRWHWLRPLQKTGSPLAKQTLLNRCISEPSFIPFICELVEHAVAATVNSSAQNVRVVLSFYVTTVVGTLQGAPKISEDLISRMIDQVQAGLHSHLTDYKCASYMILAQLSSQTQLKESFVQGTVDGICKSLSEESMLTGLMCLSTILSSQNVRSLSPKAYKALSASSLVSDGIVSGSKHHCLDLLSQLYFCKVTQDIFNFARFSEATSKADEFKTVDSLASQLRSFAADVHIKSEPIVKAMICFVIDQYLVARNVGNTDSEFVVKITSWASLLLGTLENRFASIVDKAIEDVFHSLSNNDEIDSKERSLVWIEEMVSSLPNSLKHQVVPGTKLPLLTSLLHHQSQIRVQGVKKLLKIASSKDSSEVDSEFLQTSLLMRLEDDNLDVVATVLANPSILAEYIDATQLLMQLPKIKARAHKDDRYPEFVARCTNVICHLPKSVLGEALFHSCVMDVLPDVMVSFKKLTRAKEIQEMISKSPLGKSHAVIRGIKQAYQKIDWLTLQNNGGHKDMVAKANMQLFESIVNSLASADESVLMDQFLIPCKEAQHPLLNLPQTLWNCIAMKLLGKLSGTMLLSFCQAYMCMLAKTELPVKRKAYKLDPEWLNQDRGRCLLDCIEEISVSPSDARGKHWWCFERVHFLLLQEMTAAFKRISDKPMPAAGDSSPSSKLHQLHVQLFAYLATNGGRHVSKKNFVIVYRHLLDEFFEVLYCDAADMVSFLSSVFCNDNALDWNHIDDKMDSIAVQVCSLHVAEVGLKRLLGLKIEKQVAAFVNIVPKLLVQLSHPLQVIREVACRCLAVVILSPLSLKQFSMKRLVEDVLKHKEEIIMDAERVTYLCESILAPNVDSSKKKSIVESNALALFAKCVARESRSLQLKLLTYVKNISHVAVLENLWPLAFDLIEKSRSTDLTKEDGCILQLVFSLVNEHTASIFEANSVFMSTYLDIMTKPGTYNDQLMIQQMALEQLDRHLFSAIDNPDLKGKIWRMLLDSLLDSDDVVLGTRIKTTLQELRVPTSQLSALMESLLADLQNLDEPKAKRSKRMSMAHQSSPSGHFYESRAWSSCLALLEVIRAWDDISDGHLIISSLFKFFAKCVPLDTASYSSADYMKQLLMSSILAISTHVSQHYPAGTLKADLFSVELVIQCLRSSDNPQTHQQALLLLRMVADVFPDLVLHNVMTIFTFMGAKVLRQDDSYTFDVIKRTIDTIVPALLKMDGTVNTGVVDDLVKVIARVFVDAAPHMPEHRRLHLLRHFVFVLGAEKYLYVVVLLLLEKYVTLFGLNSAKEKSEALGVEFCRSLFTTYSPAIEMATIQKILSYLPELPDEKPDGSESRKTPRKSKPTVASSCPIFDVSHHTAKELRQFKYMILDFASNALLDTTFVTKISKVKGDKRHYIDEVSLSMLTVMIPFIKRLGVAAEQHTNDVTVKFWKAVQHKSCDIVEKIYTVLPFQSFVSVLDSLIKSDNLPLKKKGLEMLSTKLNVAENITNKEESSLMALTTTLLRIISTDDESMQSALEKQTSLYTLKLLVRVLCKNDRIESFLDMVPIVTTTLQTKHQDVRVSASAVLCLAELCGALQAHVMPHLATFMPAVFSQMAENHSGQYQALVVLSNLTALSKITESLAAFLSPYVSQILGVVSELPLVIAAIQDGSRESVTLSTQINNKADALMHCVADKFSSRVLLPAIGACYLDSQTKANASCQPLMKVLEYAMTSMSRDDIKDHNAKLVSLFVTLLDTRRVWSCTSLETPLLIEQAVIDAFCCYTMKLSEHMFRPVFLQLFDWATSAPDQKDRIVTFYNLTAAVAAKLKGIFLLFVGHILPNCTDLLTSNRTATSKAVATFFEPGDAAKSVELLKHVMSCLHSSFMYDNQQFFNKERFDAVLHPLVDQIDNVIGSDDDFSSRIAESVVPCLGSLAVAIDDVTAWKVLNQQILKKTRNKLAKVRMAALDVLEEIHKRLGESYATLIPETIPFLAELMEDESVEVEKKCQHVIARLEELVGESLQKYF